MHTHWQRLIADTDRRVETFLALQNRQKGSPDWGSLTLDWGYPDPKPTLFAGAAALSAYLVSGSRYHADPVILEAYDRALWYAEAQMGPDGTFDYRPCNFRSAPDTAFVINRLVVTHDLIVASGDPGVTAFLPRIRRLIERAGVGMVAGGFHTPNHRWALAACLSSVARITGQSRFATQADRYLAEGIDGNSDGEYAERSSGIYNQVNNDQMLLLAEERRDPSYLGFVDRNLEMMLTYLNPDGTVFTANSTRQDRGIKSWLDHYYANFLLAARALDKPLFAAAARHILDGIVASGRLAPDCLDTLLVKVGTLDYGESLPPVPTRYQAFYPASGIVRVRRDDVCLSLVRGAGRFLFFQSGSLSLSLRLAVGFFQYREFAASTLTRDGEAWVLGFEARGWYYLPFPEPPATSDWWAMDHTTRPQIPGPSLTFVVRVTETTVGFDVRIRVDGTRGVPLQLEVVSSCSQIEGTGFVAEGRPGGSLLLKEGVVRMRSGLDALAWGPAFAGHTGVAGTYGSPEASREEFTVYCTDFTPMDRKLSLGKTSPGGRFP